MDAISNRRSTGNLNHLNPCHNRIGTIARAKGSSVRHQNVSQKLNSSATAAISEPVTMKNNPVAL